MRKIVLTAPGVFAVNQDTVPEPAPGRAQVKIHKVGVCGSDMHLFHHGKIGDIEMTGPLVIGHEAMGVVTSVGHGVDASIVGARVAIEPQYFCGRCRWCLAGNTNLCPDQYFLGLPPTDGAMQEYITHPADLLERLPDSLSDEAAVALEPMAIALHAVRLAKIRPPQTVVILGTGVLGTCVLMLLGLHPGLDTVCVDILPDRLERAKLLGASHVINACERDPRETVRDMLAVTPAHGADIVFECCGESETLHNMCEVAAPGGHVIVIGTNPLDAVSFSSASARRKGLTLRFVRRSLSTLAPCIELASAGRINPGAIVTHTFAASDVDNAFKIVDARGDGILKALIDMEKW